MSVSKSFSAANQAAQQMGGAMGGPVGNAAGKAAQMGLGAMMSAALGGRRDPDVAFNYMVEIDGLTLGMFTEASGIKWSMNIDEIKEGGVNNHQQHLLGRAKFDPLVLKRGFVGKDSMLFDMMYQTFDPNTPILRKIVHIVVLARGGKGSGISGMLGGNEVGRISFYNSFVQEWSGPTFNTKQNDVAVESLTFRYDWLNFHPGGPLDQMLGAATSAGMSMAGGMMAGKAPSI